MTNFYIHTIYTNLVLVFSLRIQLSVLSLNKPLNCNVIVSKNKLLLSEEISMSLMQNLLHEVQPSNWENTSYGNNFKMFELSVDSDETKLIIDEFTRRYGRKVTQIWRIQHPYAYCAFKLSQKYKLYTTPVSTYCFKAGLLYFNFICSFKYLPIMSRPDKCMKVSWIRN